MITCKLKGGLGNMLFQVATTTALALDNQDQAIFSFRNHHAGQGRSPTRYRTTIFRNLSETSWWLPQRRPKKRHSYAEKNFHYDPIPYQPHLKLEGYFQSERYFAHYHAILRQLFRPTDEQKEYLAEEYGSLLGEMPTSLHVRRGDYANLTDFHPTLTLDYYQRALEMVPPTAPVLVFSDDIDWCKETFKGSQFQFVSERNEELEIYLMSMCQNHIIANSSFSWWGAWLDGKSGGKVIAPIPWFGAAAKDHNTRDLVPDHWNRI